MRIVHTIGYEAADVHNFMQTLKAASIDLLVDVRAVAVSRRKGFSKSALASELEAHGIGYIHLRDLGDPKSGRIAARAGEYAKFRKIYGGHLKTDAAQTALTALTQLARTRRVSLLCYEADATHCHRSMICDEIAKTTKVSMVHLRVIPGGRDAVTRARASNHSGQSLAAA